MTVAESAGTYPAYKVKSDELAGLGEAAILLARNEMPGMKALEHRYLGKRPLEGARIAGCLHMTVQTAVLVRLLVRLGADVSWCSSNMLSTEDKAAAALAKQGVAVYAWKGESEEEYKWCLHAVLNRWPGRGPNLLVDDGGDLSQLLHEEYPEILPRIVGQTEQTTTGTHILLAKHKQGKLQIPAICINESVMKSKFDNVYGCRESLIDGIKRATDIMIAGKRVHVCGYGDVGKGCVQAMARMGAVVTVSEIDPICAMQAAMEGYTVKAVEEVLEKTDIWVTATGNTGVIRPQHIQRMKELAVLANIGHFNIEIDAPWIYKNAVEVVSLGNNAERVVLGSGKSVVLLAQGRLVNLGCATGHPSFIMSASFSCQALALLRLWRTRKAENSPETTPAKESANQTGGRGSVGCLTRHEDEDVARMHLEGLGHSLTELTQEQQEYLGVPSHGPYKAEGYRY